MEILMKLKCSPTTQPRSSTHSLKQYQQHQQQQSHQQKQQQQHQATIQHKQHSQQSHLPCLNYANSNQTQPNMDCCNPLNSYMNVQARCCGNSGYCSTPLPPCCSGENDGGRGLLAPPSYSNPPNYLPPSYNMLEDEVAAADNCDARYEYQEPEENFVSIDDAKIKGFLMKIGEEQRLKKQEEEELRQNMLQDQQKLQEREKSEEQEDSNKSTRRRRRRSPKVVYEIIDLDDEEERERLKRIKNQAEIEGNRKLIKERQELESQQQQQQQLQWEQNEKSPTQVTRHSPDISLVPAKTASPRLEPKQQAKNAPTRNQQRSDGPLRIVANIDLLDSSDDETEPSAPCDEDEEHQRHPPMEVMSDDEGNDAQQQEQDNDLQGNENVEGDDVDLGEVDDDDDDDYGDIPLAASSVSCELECEDDDNNNMALVQKLLKNNKNLKITKSSSISLKRQHNSEAEVVGNENEDDKNIVILASDDEFIDEHEEGLELRWEELELGTRGTRNSFECFVCGKKVQSNYNLRRHMMIHTGERPFGCDLCERRFREFSDLKKHRRRHVSEPNFKCMVCRVNPPTECDPTRCNNCDSKMGAVIAMRMKPATESTENEEARRSNVKSIANMVAASVITPQNKIPPLPPLTKAAIPIATTTTTITAVKAVSAKKAVIETSLTEDAVQQLPPLTPIHMPAEDQLVLLDHIPPVYRSNYDKDEGMVTRKEFPCPLCQRPFGTRHNLKRHFMIHTGEKPFSCTRCRKPFREYSTLKKHMITHARDRWYKCLRCPQKYLDFMEYMAHKGTHANDAQGSGGEDISGSSSNSAHSSPKKRSRQMIMGDSLDGSQGDDDSSAADDWLECCECGQRFSEFDAYTEHMKNHDVHALVYECYVCKRTFEDMQRFEEHMRVEHGTIIDSEDDEDYEDDDNDGDVDSTKAEK